MKLSSEDIDICLGARDPVSENHGAAMPPIVQASLFAQGSMEELAESLSAEHENHVYTRGRNPTTDYLATALTALERGQAGHCFASGMGAISATMFALLKSGDHVIFVNHVYGPTLQLAQRLSDFGVEHSIAAGLNPPTVEHVERSLRPNTRMIWMESPGTMLNQLIDVREVAALANERGILTVMDNSWSTPLLQKPLKLGVDIVVHTCTKYIGGHSDVVGGAVVTSRDLYTKIFHRGFLLLGAAIGPWDAWLLVRGLRTLPERLKRHEANAMDVASYLENHPAVTRVYYPGLNVNQPTQASHQMNGFSGLLSFQLGRSDYSSVTAVINALARFRIGVSWGGVESLVLSPQRESNSRDLEAAGLPPGLIRLSIGLEDPDALIADLEGALSLV